MADPFTFLVISTLLSTTAGVVAQKSAKNAADAQSKSKQNFLERQQSDQREALVENSKRQQRNKQRQLAQLRASQAASGFNTEVGTPLAIFGDIETSLDERINDQTNQALDAISRTKSQINNLKFSDKLRDSAFKTDMLSTGVNAVTGFGQGYASNYDRTGQDPFKIFGK